MKKLLFLFLVTSSLPCHSQNVYEINLSKTLNETRLGFWTIGDYKIYIELDLLLESSLRKTGKGYIDGVKDFNLEDSAATIYNLTSKRYQEAAERLKNAEYGFDLKSLIVYYGPENEKENSGNSILIENSVKQFLENGSAVVFYKNERVFTLKRRYDSQGEGLDFGYNILIYFDDEEDYVFKYYQHLGW